jgi:hypothetical protein
VDSADPRGHRRFRLTTVRGCRAELAALYTEARNKAGVDWAEAARAASVLQILSRMIEGSDIEVRIDRLEAALADRDGTRPRPNGGSRYAARP